MRLRVAASIESVRSLAGFDVGELGNPLEFLVLGEALGAYLAVLDRYSLEDLTVDGALMRQLLSAPASVKSALVPA